MPDNADRAGTPEERAAAEKRAWEIYEAVAEREAKAEAAMRAARTVLEGIRKERDAAKAALDQAMAIRNRLDMGPPDPG